ncbi:MAG: alpha/beta fold hydrolase [Candidatus Promineifilaceae bacterium]
MAYFDEGAGTEPILMLHGNPVAGYVFVPLMQELLPDYRCVIPDLFGFGMSDKPAEVGRFSLAGHIDQVAAVIRQLQLERITLVVHDWGGPIGLGAALQEPHRYRRLVLLNTMTEAPMRIMPIYQIPFYVLLRLNRLFAYLVRERNLFQRLGVAIMDPEDQAVYFRANHDWDSRAGIAAFPHMIPDSVHHPNYPILKEILARVEQWDIPSLVLFSDHDSVFSAEQGLKFARRMANARFERVDGPKHFLQYEQPQRVGRLIKEFLAT